MAYGVRCQAVPRPRSLSSSVIAAAALAVLDRDGLAGLSMRAVAEELGMSTMSLYRYVADRRELEGLVVDLVLGTVDPLLPARTTWRARVTMLADRIREAVRAHPAVVPLLLAHRHSSRSVMRYTEGFLAALTDAGLIGKARVIGLRALVSYVIGALQAQQIGPLAGSGTRVLAALPADEFPLLAQTARVARRVPADEEFHGGLTAVLNGIAGPRPPASRSGRRS
jgi:AcrR family transcriptional regulator